MGKLHELIAVEPGIAGEAKKVMDEAVSIFKRREHFTGEIRKTELFDDNRKQEEVTEHKALDTTVDAKLAYVHDSMVRHLDAFVQKETTNTVAKANIELPDGTVLAENVPAAALLGLESRLKAIRDMYGEIPTLPPGVEWEWDEQTEVFRQKHPEQKLKTEKALKWQEVSKATDKHPAQVEKWNADVPIGKIIVTQTSGMLTPAQKSKLLGRIDTLLRAVVQARQRANCAEVIPVEIGQKIVDYIHG